MKLKKGAQIMLLNNDSLGQWINGTIGKIRKFEKDDDGRRCDCGRTGQRRYGAHFSLHLENLPVLSEKRRAALGRSRIVPQYPVRLAFAVTIHKSQGKTFENVVIDVGRGTFAHGQMYVALSRCTTLNGIVLKQPLKKNHILMDWQVVKFLTGHSVRSGRQNLQPRRQAENDRARRLTKRQISKSSTSRGRMKNHAGLVRPLFIGEMEYKGYPYLGLEAFCLNRREKRIFNVDKILEIAEQDQPPLE